VNIVRWYNVFLIKAKEGNYRCKKNVVIGLDIGTISIKVISFDRNSYVLGEA